MVDRSDPVYFRTGNGTPVMESHAADPRMFLHEANSGILITKGEVPR